MAKDDFEADSLGGRLRRYAKVGSTVGGQKVRDIADLPQVVEDEGIVVGVVLQPTLPPVLAPYLPIAIVAAFDAILGATRAYLEGIFSDRVFLVSFLSNVVVAGFIVFLGDKLGVGSQLSIGVVVVLGVRIFSTVASIRSSLFGA